METAAVKPTTEPIFDALKRNYLDPAKSYASLVKKPDIEGALITDPQQV